MRRWWTIRLQYLRVPSTNSTALPALQPLLVLEPVEGEDPRLDSVLDDPHASACDVELT